jgi:hypothetical protein
MLGTCFVMGELLPSEPVLHPIAMRCGHLRISCCKGRSLRTLDQRVRADGEIRALPCEVGCFLSEIGLSAPL